MASGRPHAPVSESPSCNKTVQTRRLLRFCTHACGCQAESPRLSAACLPRKTELLKPEAYFDPWRETLTHKSRAFPGAELLARPGRVCLITAETKHFASVSLVPVQGTEAPNASTARTVTTTTLWTPSVATFILAIARRRSDQNQS